MDVNNPRDSDSEQDWRLMAELQSGDVHGTLGRLLGRLRGPDVVQEIEAEVPDHVVITHDGQLLFAYAADETTLRSARSAIENVLARDQVAAGVTLSHWEHESDRWRQVDPPLTAEQLENEAAVERDEEAIETRTLVASSGNMIRTEFEQVMSNWAVELGLECKVIEHPHLLRTQVAFTVTGPKRRIDEFSRGLLSEGWATIRTETNVMLSPL